MKFLLKYRPEEIRFKDKSGPYVKSYSQSPLEVVVEANNADEATQKLSRALELVVKMFGDVNA